MVVYLLRTNLGRKSIPSEDWGILIGTSAMLSLVLDAIALLIAFVIKAAMNVMINPTVITVVLTAVFVVQMVITDRGDVE